MADLFTRAAYALRELRRHGAIRSPWLAGMRLGRVPGTHDRGHWLHVRLGDTFAEPSDGRIWLPDLTDPLTVAALGVLAEEAWAAAGVRVLYLEPDDRLNPGAGWDAYACHDGGRIECVGRGAAKADAWTAALEARVLALTLWNAMHPAQAVPVPVVAAAPPAAPASVPLDTDAPVPAAADTDAVKAAGGGS